MFGFIYRTLTDHDIRFAFKNGPDELFNVFAAVLVIGICVDYDIRTVTKARIDAGHETFCKAFVAREVYNVVDTPLFGNFNRIVRTAVIDDQILDLINPVYVFRKIV